MNRRLTALALGSLLLLPGTAAVAAEKSASAPSSAPSPEMVTSYLKVQDALASDNLADARKSAEKLAQGTAPRKIAAPAAKLAQAQDIRQAREEFKALSAPFVAWASRSKPKDLEIYFCPMVKAKWVQKAGDIRNPYYGKDMLECGEKAS